MTRYKTKIFFDFSDGQQCDILDLTKKSFKASENLVIQKNKIKLGWKIKNDALYDSTLDAWSSEKLSFIYSYRVYFMSTDGSDCIIKRCSLTDGSFQTLKTFADSSGDIPYCLIKFRGLAIASYKNNAGTSYLCKYSTDGMTMATWANTNLIGKIGSHYIKDYKIVHDRLYILTSNNRLLYSDDGITFESLITLDSSYSYKNLEYLDGYLYILNYSLKSVRGLVRVSLSGEIQDEVVSFNSIYAISLKVFLGKIYLLADSLYLYRIEGSVLIPIYQFDAGYSFLNPSDYVNKLSFHNSNTGVVLSMNADEKFSSPYKIIGIPISIHNYNKEQSFIICNYGTDTAQVAIYNGRYNSSGNVQTRVFKTKGSFIPIQITALQKPLTANAWVKIYIKKDGASSWGSAVIDSNATNAVKKSYNFPAGDDLRTIEFKIEYGTTDDAETPEDVALEFIYLPIELANAE